MFFVQTERRTPRVTVREVSPLDDRCRRAGGTRELERVALPARTGVAPRPAYACLHDASAEVTARAREILATDARDE